MEMVSAKYCVGLRGASNADRAVRCRLSLHLADPQNGAEDRPGLRRSSECRRAGSRRPRQNVAGSLRLPRASQFSSREARPRSEWLRASQRGWPAAGCSVASRLAGLLWWPAGLLWWPAGLLWWPVGLPWWPVGLPWLPVGVGLPWLPGLAESARSAPIDRRCFRPPPRAPAVPSFEIPR